ncbi:MAG: alternative ribosome rescue aminoacyl-tRNA hydrolase ArfB [Pseudomonadota bacterium]|nr:alternative ribosome rescue aminoacyl-tRNA hydrolase ArfB [Pseudomonadota bacterium]
MIKVTDTITIPEEELEISAIRAQGSGGQNVNKVSSAIHLRFDIGASSLPEADKTRLLAYSDQRITKDGVVVIKAQNFRTQEKNRADAIERLIELIRLATAARKARRPTRASRASQQRRVDRKTHRGKIKALRGKPTE